MSLHALEERAPLRLGGPFYLGFIGGEYREEKEGQACSRQDGHCPSDERPEPIQALGLHTYDAEDESNEGGSDRDDHGARVPLTPPNVEVNQSPLDRDGEQDDRENAGEDCAGVLGHRLNLATTADIRAAA